jgi:hypothetical protein
MHKRERERERQRDEGGGAGGRALREGGMVGGRELVVKHYNMYTVMIHMCIHTTRNRSPVAIISVEEDHLRVIIILVF